jgi:DNA-binding transcriptional MerR regulator
MISIDDALWLRSLGVADADIKARMTDTDTQKEQTEQKEQKTEQTEQKEEQKEQKQTEQKETAGQQKTETKPDNTTAVLMEVIKTLQAQNAKLAAGQGAGSDEKIEDMLLSLI